MGATVLTKLKFKPVKKWLITKNKSQKITATNIQELTKKIIEKV